MCKITTCSWFSCGTPLDDVVKKCAEAENDGQNPYRCPSTEEDEHTVPGCCGHCDHLGTPVSLSASEADYGDEEGDEEDQEDGEGEEDEQDCFEDDDEESESVGDCSSRGS